MEAYDSTGWIVVSTLDLTAISNSMTIVGSKTYDQKIPIFPINIKLKQKKNLHWNTKILEFFAFFHSFCSEWVKSRTGSWEVPLCMCSRDAGPSEASSCGVWRPAAAETPPYLALLSLGLSVSQPKAWANHPRVLCANGERERSGPKRRPWMERQRVYFYTYPPVKVFFRFLNF